MMISLLYYLFKRRVIHAVLKKSNKRFTYYSITHLCRNLCNISMICDRTAIFISHRNDFRLQIERGNRKYIQKLYLLLTFVLCWLSKNSSIISYIECLQSGVGQQFVFALVNLRFLLRLFLCLLCLPKSDFHI